LETATYIKALYDSRGLCKECHTWNVLGDD